MTMNKIALPFFLSFVFIVLVGCTSSRREPAANAADSVSLEIKYAQGFKVSDHGSYKTVEVTYPYQGAQSGYTYLLVQKGEPVPAHDPTTPVITIPLESIVCTSTTHIPALDYLNETDALTGFPSTDYISSRKMRTRIDEGKVKDLGMDKSMNLELLVTLKPSMVMGYSMNNDVGQMKKIQELGIPIVVNAEYLEKHPLGRAEWIKFMALFFNKEKEADSVFRLIESEYNKTQELAKTVVASPTVMSGIVYGDTWFLPGGSLRRCRTSPARGRGRRSTAAGSASRRCLPSRSRRAGARDYRRELRGERCTVSGCLLGRGSGSRSRSCR